MAPQPEQQARGNIDRLLEAAGWHVCDASAANIHAARGVAIREFPLPGYGFADYLLYVDGKAAGVIEAKKEGVTLTGVETQSDKYTKGLPAGLPRWSNPLPFAYQTTGVETRFTNGLDPVPRARPVFAFHKPELFASWLSYAPTAKPEEGSAGETASTFLARLQAMPPLKEEGLWPAQITAIHNRAYLYLFPKDARRAYPISKFLLLCVIAASEHKAGKKAARPEVEKLVVDPWMQSAIRTINPLWFATKGKK